MRIVQITDLHIGQVGEDTYGVDVRANFLALLDEAAKCTPDLVVLSGDLCYRDGDAQIYDWVKSQMDASGLPYELLSGNHDDPALMARTFGREGLLKEAALYYTKEVQGQRLIFLDSTPRQISEAQLSWLEAALKQIDGAALVFMHHPPVLAGLPFMDKNHALINRAAVQAVFESHPHPVYVFTGHYHTEKAIHSGKLSVFITPSCFFQIGQRSEAFEVDHYRVGLRCIDWDGERLEHSVRYLWE